MDLMLFIDSFLWALRAEKFISKNTYSSYFYDLKSFASWCYITEISFEDPNLVISFSSYLKEAKLNSESSVVRKIHVLLKFFEYCNLEKGTVFVIPEEIKTKIRRIYRPFIEEDDFLKMRNFLTASSKLQHIRLLFILETLYSTGLRVSELLKLKLSDVDSIKKYRSLRIVGKGEGVRLVFFNDFAIRALELYLLHFSSDSDFLLPLTRQRVFQLLKVLGQELGFCLHTIFPHSFRHRMLTDLVKKGMHLVNVQKIAGHKQISTTERYTHVEDYLYEEIYKFHPLVKKFFVR